MLSNQKSPYKTKSIRIIIDNLSNTIFGMMVQNVGIIITYWEFLQVVFQFQILTIAYVQYNQRTTLKTKVQRKSLSFFRFPEDHGHFRLKLTLVVDNAYI